MLLDSSYPSKEIFLHAYQKRPFHELITRTNTFHRHHGSNIVLCQERVTATRSTSFANALTFSEKPLASGELFLIEIEENETGWSGNMRIGLTQMNPSKEFPLPMYALPDLVSMGPSWLYAITKTHNNVYSAARRETSRAGELLRRRGRNSQGDDAEADPVLQGESDDPDQNNEENNGVPNDALVQEALFSYRRSPIVLQTGEGSLVRTPRGFIQLKALLPSITKSREYEGMNLLATDIGSRIGVMYVPTSETKADMHFIINGEDQGPCARDIPYQVSLCTQLWTFMALPKKFE
ncbi:Neuralized-like protein 2 [Orchesella cincta]|uniref:Neuralized-like protein 2 n=1 Tax=Orchesella cincta TaxID=48709 RepID=A0A1D2ML63_ORCCI|nr:Neuralized-like protein 2 [Orchesella cincta]